MKKLFLAFCPALTLVFSGCSAYQTLAEGIGTKNVSGDGVVAETHIGLDFDNKIPEIKTFFVSGDIATVKAGTNAISYREESSASIWNAKSVTKKRFLSITLTDAGDVPAAIRAVGEIILIVSEADKAGEAVSQQEGDGQKPEAPEQKTP